MRRNLEDDDRGKKGDDSDETISRGREGRTRAILLNLGAHPLKNLSRSYLISARHLPSCAKAKGK